MIKNKLVTAVLVLILILIGIIWWLVSGKKQSNLVAPGLQQDRQNPNLSPTPSIKTFQFDSATDLEAELEKVDPKVLDSDFSKAGSYD